jgi:chemotaxis protein MotB
LINKLTACTAERKRLKESMAREAERLKEVLDSLKKRLEKEINRGEIEILQYEGVLIVNIHNNVLFMPDSPVLIKEYEPILNIIAESFKKIPEKIIRVEGHTASRIKSIYETSWQLGAERSLSVIRFFQEKCHIDPLRLVLLSFGEYRPIASNITEEGRIKNRRVQIVFIDRPLYQVRELKQIK